MIKGTLSTISKTVYNKLKLQIQTMAMLLNED